MKIPTHHIDPREAVSCVGMCFIQSHDVSEVGQLGILLFEAHLQKTRQDMEYTVQLMYGAAQKRTVHTCFDVFWAFKDTFELFRESDDTI